MLVNQDCALKIISMQLPTLQLQARPRIKVLTGDEQIFPSFLISNQVAMECSGNTHFPPMRLKFEP